jgi:hypothetical protein
MSYFTFSTEKHPNNLTAFYNRTVRLLFLYKQLLYNELLTQYKIISYTSWCSTDFRNEHFLGSLCSQAYIYPRMPLILPSTLHSGFDSQQQT